VGDNLLVCLDAPRRSLRTVKDLEVDIVPYPMLGELLDAM